MSTSSVALMGGTFDPIHLGHVVVARSVREQLCLDQVIFIPSANPPHKDQTPISDIAHRLAMVKLAIEAEEGFACDDCEAHRRGPSYSYDTVTHFRRRLGRQARIHWIIGADSLAELESWYRVNDLVNSCQIITVSRPGWEQPDLSGFGQVLGADRIAKLKSGIIQTPRVDISATEIRRRLAAGQSVHNLVPEPVRQYIDDHQLYRPCI